MNKLFRIYNQNRHIIWIIILTVVAVLAIIQILNNYAGKKLDNMNNMEINEDNEGTSYKINESYSVITKEENKPYVKDIIKEFINYCNEGDVSNAYGLLSDECKEVLYPTVQDFKNNYYNKIFTNKKTYLCQAWITNNDKYTYKIDFTQDMLSTGKTSRESITDYYTVVDDRLNINKFIGIKEINRIGTQENIIINVIKKIVYIDYEIYEIETLNKTKDIICLDDLQSTSNVYIEDNNNFKYIWYSHELLKSDVTVRGGATQKLSIKFDKAYKPTNEPIKMVFSKVVLSNDKLIEIGIDL